MSILIISAFKDGNNYPREVGEGEGEGGGGGGHSRAVSNLHWNQQNDGPFRRQCWGPKLMHDNPGIKPTTLPMDRQARRRVDHSATRSSPLTTLRFEGLKLEAIALFCFVCSCLYRSDLKSVQAICNKCVCVIWTVEPYHLKQKRAMGVLEIHFYFKLLRI